MIVDDDDHENEDGNGEDSTPKRVRRRILSLIDLALPRSDSNILEVLIFSPWTFVNFAKFFHMPFGPRVWGQWWVGPFRC